MAKRRWGRRAMGVLFLLLLLELALQAAGPLVQRAMARRQPDASPDARLTILCVGDSNTFGLHMPQLYAYPALLQSRLEQRFHSPVTVANRGVPGHNSAQVLAALPQDLADTRPDLVLVLCGINDAWNTSAEARGALGLIEQLKLVRLVRVLLSGVTTATPFAIRTDERGEFVVDRGSGEQRVNMGADGAAVRSGKALQQHVRAGLEAIVERCADAGATPVLMTYAEFQGEFAGLNATARALAADRGLLLVDHERAFGERFSVDGYESLMLNDHHPNLRGYQLMAEQVDAVLTGAGWVPAAADTVEGPATGTGTGPTAAVVPANLELLADGRLLIGGPPRTAFMLLMSHTPDLGSGFEVGGVPVPLADDEVLAMSRLEPSFSGQLDATGRAEVDVPPRLRAAAGDAGLVACVLLLRDPAAAAAPGGTPLLGASGLLVVVE